MDERLQKATEEKLRRLQRAAEEGDVEALFLILAEERLQRLQRAAADEDVQALFTILADEPLVLERFDEKAFLSTPLHTAVSGGKIHFAMEIVNLKPSFAGKRDHLGRSPLHLALEGKHQVLKERNPPHLALEENYQEKEGRGPFDLDLEGKYQELVTWLIQIDSELVRVKSKGLVTPLHYAAEIDDDSNLADFLYVCPSSIRDLTVTGETAVHVAVKNGSRRALKVLLKWIQRFGKEGILNWEDEEGNNALHTAISENQIEVVKLLIEYMEVNKKNRQGLTALDIFDNHRDSLNAEIGEILLVYKDKRDFEVAALPRFICRFISGLEKQYFSSGNSPVEYISVNLPLATRFLQGMGLGAQSIKKVPVEVLNVLLVVAALITTTTYQAALSPPGGYWQDDGNLPANNTVINKNTNTTSILRGKEPSQQRAGNMIQGSFLHLCFLLLNSVAFFASVCSILILISRLPFSKFITVPTCLIVFSFTFAVMETFPFPFKSTVGRIFFLLMLGILIYAFYYPFGFYAGEERKLIQCGRRKKLRLGSFEDQLRGNNIG